MRNILIGIGLLFTLSCLSYGGVRIKGTTCLDVSSDRIYHDTDCDGTKDAGEGFIDQAGGGGAGSVRIEDDGSLIVNTSTMNFTGDQFIVTDDSGEALVALDPSSVTMLGADLSGSFIANQDTLQTGSTFYVEEGRTNGDIHLGDDLYIGNSDTIYFGDTVPSQIDGTHSTSGYLLFRPGGLGTSESVNMKRNGSVLNVGIGEFSPSETLDVDGNVKIQDSNELKMYDADSSNYVSFESTATLAGDVSFVLPPTDGSSAEVLHTDGSGNLYFDTDESAGDNLGSHIATQTLNMGGFQVTEVASITMVSNEYPVIYSTWTQFSIQLTNTSDNDFQLNESSAQLNGLEISTLGQEIDISDESNLAVSAPITLTDDTVGIDKSSATLLGPTIEASEISDLNANTDITADLEEESHCSEHDSADVNCSGETILLADDSVGTAEMADEDHGDVSWSGGSATVDNVAAENVAAGSLGDSVIASSIAVDAVGVAQLSATGTPDGTTYLRGDNTWSTVDASPGGSDTQIQYNDGGSFGGDADFVWDDSNNYIGISTDNPQAHIHMVPAGTGDVNIMRIDRPGIPNLGRSMFVRYGGPLGSLTLGGASFGWGGINNANGSQFAINDSSDENVMLAGTSTSGNWKDILFFSSVTIRDGYQVRLGDADSSNYVQLRASATVASNVDLVMPPDDGDSGEAMITDGSGVLRFDNLSTANIDPQAAWRVFISSGDSSLQEIALGADGTYLKSNGASTSPSWATPSGGVSGSVMAYRTTDLSVAASSDTILVCNTERHDIDGEYNTTTGVFWAGSDGVYIVSAYAYWNGVDSGKSYMLRLYHNGTETTRDQTTINATGSYTNKLPSTAVNVSAGDSIVIKAFHTATGTELILGAASDALTGISIYRVQ